MNHLGLEFVSLDEVAEGRAAGAVAPAALSARGAALPSAIVPSASGTFQRYVIGRLATGAGSMNTYV